MLCFGDFPHTLLFNISHILYRVPPISQPFSRHLVKYFLILSKLRHATVASECLCTEIRGLVPGGITIRRLLSDSRSQNDEKISLNFWKRSPQVLNVVREWST